MDGETWTNSIGMEFVRIPDADTEAKDWEKPAHQVTISQPFYLGKYPVTQAQWEAVLDNNPSRFKASNRLVDSVSWADAANQLITRWDNTPHFPDLPGFPDHIHNGATGEVTPGQPMSILPYWMRSLIESGKGVEVWISWHRSGHCRPEVC